MWCVSHSATACAACVRVMVMSQKQARVWTVAREPRLFSAGRRRPPGAIVCNLGGITIGGTDAYPKHLKMPGTINTVHPGRRKPRRHFCPHPLDSFPQKPRVERLLPGTVPERILSGQEPFLDESCQEPFLTSPSKLCSSGTLQGISTRVPLLTKCATFLPRRTLDSTRQPPPGAPKCRTCMRGAM